MRKFFRIEVEQNTTALPDRVTRNYRLQLPLHIGIITAFLLLAVPSIIGLIWFVYHRNSIEMRAVADDTMAHASAAMISQGVDLVDAVGDTVDLLAAMGNTNLEELRNAQLLSVLLNAVQNAPQTYAFYAAFGSDGAFNQAVRLPTGVRIFNNSRVPEGAKYAFRQLVRTRQGQSSDTYTYLSEDGAILSRETVRNPQYDPRVRSFFQSAIASPDQRLTSEVYAFASTGNLGVTISHAFSSKSGRIAGVAAADIELNSMSEFLSQHTPGRHGIAIIIDDKGHLVAHPDPTVFHREGVEIAEIQASALNDTRVHGALAAHAGRPGVDRQIFTGKDGNEYIASFTPFPASLGTRWQLLIVLPTDDFVGGLKQATRQVLLMGLGVLLVVLVGIRSLSKTLTSSIARLIEETQRIRRFELDGGLHVPSRITEILLLTEAMRTVKTALSSVAKFMPRTLVRDLLSTGQGLDLGGENRVISVMFTDLANFSSVAEKVSAQDLALRTSDYLEVVSQEVIRRHGTIDKYIGDSVMALWGAPIPDGDHIQHACLAALHALRAFQKSNDQWARKGWQPLDVRIGLHAGSVVVGVIGSREHMSYTALGDGVNIAARLESINKVYGTSICVSGAIHDAISGQFLMRPLGRVALKGRKAPSLIYELMGALSEDSEIAATAEQREQARMTESAFGAWIDADIPAALAQYQTLLDRFPNDSVARFYVAECTQTLKDSSLAKMAV
jgi:adenylate cyclase